MDLLPSRPSMKQGMVNSRRATVFCTDCSSFF